ncbi:ABC transporter ATP-binding protein [uncultured Castellaniella sp.]|uniref:dipeptide ABC transporter ATP-binding protein n=1 Tax=uncultured Castellaniella sp. TaxID=647907 RepID=UPI00261B54AE|nr:ABC transporter ATP-binding protein [uncultured Castellaniella sp.]
MTHDLILGVENLHIATTRHAARSLVDGTSFSVSAGETLCIVGESGSGKSLTALAIMGLLPRGALEVTGGEIRVVGESVIKAPAPTLRKMRSTVMSMIFQEPMTALNPVQRIGSQVEEVLARNTGLDRRQRRAQVLAMLESVHLPDPVLIFNSYPHQLSGGQRQRVMIAMALILKPKLLIADEPTTALDVTTQKQILSLIKELQHDQGTCVLFITHDFGVVSDVADNILVMCKGRQVEMGSRLSILSSPTDGYTKMLLESVPGLVAKGRTITSESVRLRVSELSKTYRSVSLFGAGRSVRAVSEVSLTLHSNEIMGIVGESGSGKSTVARCLVRLLDPSKGDIFVKSTNIARLPKSRLRAIRPDIQIVFQDPYRSLNPRQRIGKSLIEGLLNYGVSRQDALSKISDVLKLVGLDDSILNRFPHEFSGGQRQRLCLARAVVMEPSILIADEAVSALDVSVQAQVLQLLKQVRERTGIAILFITHDLRVAAEICDSIIVMQNGRIVEAGKSDAVLSVPRHEYTKNLLSSVPGRDWDFQNFRPFGEKRAAHSALGDLRA